MNIGKNILELRKRKNVSQDELAVELGVTATAVSKWENGYTLPDILMLGALADYFGVTADELLGRTREWKYAVIAAQTAALGEQISTIAKEYGIATRGIFTSFAEAVEAAQQDGTVRYIVAGFYTGYYGDTTLPCLVSVAPTDQEILDGFRYVFETYLPE